MTTPTTVKAPAFGTDQRGNTTAAAPTTSVGQIGHYSWQSSPDYNPSITFGVKNQTTPGTPGAWAEVMTVDPYSIQVSGPEVGDRRLTDIGGKPVVNMVPNIDGTAINPQIAQGIQTKTEKDKKGNVHTYVYIPGSADQTTVVPNTLNASDVLDKIRQWASSSDEGDQQRFQDVQDKLVAGHLLDPNKMIRGYDDPYTEAALENVVNLVDKTRPDAKSPTKDFNAVLDDLAAKGAATTSTQQSRNYQLTTQTDVSAHTRKMSPDLIGRGVTPSELASLTSGYNTIEMQAENAAFNARDANAANLPATSVVSPNPPDLDSYIQQQLTQQNPTATQGMQMAQYVGQFMDLLNRPAPKIGPA